MSSLICMIASVIFALSSVDSGWRVTNPTSVVSGSALFVVELLVIDAMLYLWFGLRFGGFLLAGVTLLPHTWSTCRPFSFLQVLPVR